MADSTPTPGDGGDIIIKGGSCKIRVADSWFENDPTEPPYRRHKRADVKITRIVITGNSEFDSKDLPDGFKGKIRITYK